MYAFFGENLVFFKLRRDSTRHEILQVGGLDAGSEIILADLFGWWM